MIEDHRDIFTYLLNDNGLEPSWNNIPQGAHGAIPKQPCVNACALVAAQ